MPEFFEYDPDTGIRTDWEWDGTTGKATFFHTQDIEFALERAKLSRDNGLRDHGIKENWFHYCDIPLIFVMRLRKMGIRLDDHEAVITAINTYWPFLKYTRKNEGKKLGTSVDMGKNSVKTATDYKGLILEP